VDRERAVYDFETEPGDEPDFEIIIPEPPA